VVLLSDPTAILGEIQMINYLDLSSKVSFITNRLNPNLHCFSRVRMKYHVVLLSDPTAILGEIRTINYFDLRSRVSFITDRFNLTFSACSASVGSTT
jgi:hypothetical protein